ncbi:MAG: lytic transglycosylase domain-containing protein, partial [Siphonobacter sp.]
MRINLLLLSCCLFFTSITTYAQLFQVPSHMTFGNVGITLDPGARDIVQIDVYALLSNRNTLNTRLDRAALYFPIIEKVLTQENVPTDFKYLVLQESGLTPDAISSSNAVGFWQMKKESASDFGLRMDNEIDERKNIHASTKAAARYLKRSNAVLDNWVSTLFSYYLGLGGIKNLIPANWTGAKEITLTDKNDRYILRCLAHKLVYENELKSYRSSLTPFYEYKGGSGKTFTQIADELSVDEVELRRYNRWMGGSKVPQDREYIMLVTVPGNQLTDSNSRPLVNNTPIQPQPTAKPKPKEPDFPVLKRVTPTGKNQSTRPIY